MIAIGPGVVLPRRAIGGSLILHTGVGFPAGPDAAVGVQEEGQLGKFTEYWCGSTSLVFGQHIHFIPDPGNEHAPVIGGTPTEGRTLTSTPGTWTGTEPITLRRHRR